MERFSEALRLIFVSGYLCGVISPTFSSSGRRTKSWYSSMLSGISSGSGSAGFVIKSARQRASSALSLPKN